MKNKAELVYHTNTHELTFHGIVYSNSLLLLHYIIWIASAHRNTHPNQAAVCGGCSPSRLSPVTYDNREKKDTWKALSLPHLLLCRALASMFRSFPSEERSSLRNDLHFYVLQQFLAIPFFAPLTDIQEQILPLAAFSECFWEASCLEGKVDTKVPEDWQNNLSAQLVRGEDGYGKPEDCRFSFQWDTSLEKQIWSFIKINLVYSLLSVLNTVPIMKLRCQWWN